MSPAEPRIFRATTEAWVGQFLLPLLFIGLLSVTAVRAARVSQWIGWVGFGVFALIAALDMLLPMLRNWLQLDARSIEGSLNGRYFQTYWTEVLAAWVHHRRGRRFLCLGTREGILIFPLRFFDEPAIWQHVSTLVSPEALAEDAIKRLPDFKEWEEGRERLLENETKSVVIDHWLIQVLGWGGLTFFIFCAVRTISVGQLQDALLYLTLAAVSGYFLLNWGITELGVETVERHTVLGAARIAWSEVRSIELDPLEMVIVLTGENSQLVIPGPWLWAGVDKKIVLSLILAQSEKHHIPLRRTPWAIFKFSRNTRVRR